MSKRIFAWLCLLSFSFSALAINEKKEFLSLEIIQTLDNHSALAKTRDWDVVEILSEKDIYFDGKKISDYFVFVGTYSYETTTGISKTVPVYRRYSELNEPNSRASKQAQNETTLLSVEVFQTLDTHIALARTNDWTVVRIDSENEVFYDGKKLSGKFILIDTYRYETTNGMVKTVPVYVTESEYYGKPAPERKPSPIILSVEVFQTLNKHEALAKTSSWDVVKLETTEDIYYDGKKISGSFILAGTYRYTTNDNWEKTVPVYIRESEYRKLMKNNLLD